MSTMDAWRDARNEQRDIAEVIADQVVLGYAASEDLLTDYRIAKRAEKAAFDAWAASTKHLNTEHLSTEEN